MSHQICLQVQQSFSAYEELLTCLKQTSGPNIVMSERRVKHNRSGVMFTELAVENAEERPNMTFSTELSVRNSEAFKFRLEDRDFMNPPILRYDSKGVAHRNPPNTGPLSEQKVTAPHFQKFDSQGYSVAYKTPRMQTEEGAQELTNIKYSIMHFYQEANMLHDGELPELEIEQTGLFTIPYPSQPDPNANVTYFA